jgi:hypothetical protein
MYANQVRNGLTERRRVRQLADGDQHRIYDGPVVQHHLPVRLHLQRQPGIRCYDFINIFDKKKLQKYWHF